MRAPTASERATEVSDQEQQAVDFLRDLKVRCCAARDAWSSKQHHTVEAQAQQYEVHDLTSLHLYASLPVASRALVRV